MTPRRLAALSCAGLTGLAAIALLIIGLGRGWAFERELFWVRASGWGALLALSASLSATPIGRALALLGARGSRPHVSALRRALGLTSAALATGHGAAALATYLRDSLDALLDFAWVRAGILGWAILAVLALTSSARIVRLARVRAWKSLHRLAYVAGLLAVQHLLLAPLAPRGWVLAVFGTTVAIGALRWLPARRSARADLAAVEAETVEAETVEAETVEAETVEAETIEAETIEADGPEPLASGADSAADVR